MRYSQKTAYSVLTGLVALFPIKDLQAQAEVHNDMNASIAARMSSDASDANIKRQLQDLQAQLDTLSAKVNYGGKKGNSYAPVAGFTADFEFLYWKADEDGLEYGTKMVAGPLIGESSTNKTHLLDLHFDWDPGFRLGLGYFFNHFDQWSLGLNWTHIQNHAQGKSSAHGIESQVGPVDTIISPWVSLLFELRAGASKANAHWHVNYDTLDLDLKRNFYVSKRLGLQPFIGFRGASIDQHYHVKYKGVFLLGESMPFFTRDVKFSGKNDYWGFGLHGGTDLSWHLAKHWMVFGELSASIVYGRFNVKMKNLHDQGLGEGSIPPSPLNFYASEKLWRTRFNFDEAIGLAWETFFNKDKYHVSIKAAYEMTQWLNQNELFYTFYFRGADTISSVPIRSKGNLGFHGLTAGIQFDF